MGLLDRLKTNRHGDDGAHERVPTNFDELQAAEPGEAPAATAIESRHAESGHPTVDAALTSTLSGASIISELPASGELSDFSDSRVLPAALAAGAALAAPAAVALPLIGDRPLAAQQRILGAVLPVPHTRPWLAGVVNLRGGVCTVVDLARFLGLRAAGSVALGAVGPQSRLVAFNAALGLNGALLVDRLEGLRHAADLQVEPETPDNQNRPAFALARWRDAAGKVWQELDLAELARQPQFLAITA